MNQAIETSSAYRAARSKVHRLKGFYTHLFFYLLVNAGLIALNLLYSPGHLWFFWPLLGWGIGIASHAFNTFQPFSLFSKNWEERKIREYLEKESK